MNGQDEQLKNCTRYVLWNTVQDDDGILTISIGEYVKVAKGCDLPDIRLGETSND